MSTHPVGLTAAIRLHFDGPPGQDQPRLVDVEDDHGRPVRVGDWQPYQGVIDGPDDPRRTHWELRIDHLPPHRPSDDDPPRPNRRYLRRALEVTADPWHTNGDHPDDRVGEQLEDPFVQGTFYTRQEGAVVRRFRRPETAYNGRLVHAACDRTWNEHGWIDSGGEGRIVCPGDYVIGYGGDYWPLKPDQLQAFYAPAPTPPAPGGVATAVHDAEGTFDPQEDDRA